MSSSSILQSILHPRKKAGKHSTHQHIGFDPNLGLVCPYCHGTGFRNNSNPITAISLQPQRCNVCGGSGRIPC